MKIDKDDLLFGAIIGGLVICSPFIAMYHIGKWIYSKTPQKIKEQKAEEKKREEMNREIHELEKQLGLAERDDSYMHYDPLYMGNEQRGREGYWADLKKKVASGYKSPDLIWMIKEVKSGLCAPRFGYGDCQVLLLLHKDCYDILGCAPVESGTLEHLFNGSEGPGKLPRADRYVKAAYEMMTFFKRLCSAASGRCRNAGIIRIIMFMRFRETSNSLMWKRGWMNGLKKFYSRFPT